MTALKKHNPLKAFLDEYSRCVLSGDRDLAINYIMNLAKNDAIEVKEIYQYIIKPFQLELGRLWETNLITVGQEHYATALSQFAMGLLYERIFKTQKNGRVFLGICAHGDLHELGIRMVCDFMEYSGWRTYYLGANKSNCTIIERIQDINPHIIAISCTMAHNLPSVEHLISEIKESGIKIPIIVGGHAVNLNRSMWQKAGADGYSEELDEILSLSEKLSVGGFFEDNR